jgi:tetratricopeptide (TPR) repeat protein
MYIIFALIIYLIIGVGRIVRDFVRPFINQPYYVRHPKLFQILMYIVTWPLLFISDINYFYRRCKVRKKRKKEILRKYVEKNKYLSAYYKSSFFDELKALKQNNSFDEIIKICDQYLKNNNPHPLVKAELWSEIGFSYKMIGENYKAIEMFVKVLEIDNEHLDASEGLAQTYLKLKDYDSTIEWLQKSKENFKIAINDSKILEAPNNRVKQLTDELNKIEILLESLKSGYKPE